MRSERRSILAAVSDGAGIHNAGQRKAAKHVSVLEPDEDTRNVVNSLAKGLRVLEAFSAERSELTLTEVAATGEA